MNRTDRGLLIEAYPVLRELPAPLLERLEAVAEELEVPDGREVFPAGEPATRLPLVVRGVARVSRASPDGGEVLLYRVAPGESCVVTAVSLLAGADLTASVSAEGTVRLVAIPRALFLELVLASAPFRAFVFGDLARRMGQLMTLVDDLVHRRVDERLASLLLQKARPIAATHQALACEIGTSREVVSRILEGFQAGGMIRLGRKRIEILDPGALERLLGRTPPPAS